MKRPKNGGRQKGTPNKATKTLRQWVNDFIITKTQQIENDWQELKPHERINAFQQLLKYALPTLTASTNSIDFERMTDEQLDEIINKLTQKLNNHGA